MKNFDWIAIEHQVRDIAEKYKDQGYKYIVGISRGGLIPAVMLSHLMGLPIETLRWQTRDGFRDYEKLTTLTRLIDWRQKVLVVDDIYDTGRTFEELEAFLPTATYVTLVKKRDFEGYSPLTVEGKDWINFPWELKQ